MFLKIFRAIAASCVALTAAACDTRETFDLDAASPFNSHRGLGSIIETVDDLGNQAPLTLLPQDNGAASPACLDGSPYGFYFVPSTTGSTQWTISIEGGGWCYDEELCYKRSQMNLGSSKKCKFIPGTHS